MTWKQTFALGAVSAALSSSACVIYLTIYEATFFVDFSAVLGIPNAVAASVVGCILMAVAYKLALQRKGPAFLGWMNVGFAIVSFASIAGVFGFHLPLDVEFPEMFPGLAIPMHFFPLLSLLTIVPFFGMKETETKTND